MQRKFPEEIPGGTSFENLWKAFSFHVETVGEIPWRTPGKSREEHRKKSRVKKESRKKLQKSPRLNPRRNPIIISSDKTQEKIRKKSREGLWEQCQENVWNSFCRIINLNSHAKYDQSYHTFGLRLFALLDSRQWESGLTCTGRGTMENLVFFNQHSNKAGTQNSCWNSEICLQ